MTEKRINARGRIGQRLCATAWTACILGTAIQVVPCHAGPETLPKAETIIEKNIEVTGGRAAYEKLHNRVTKGTFGMPGMGKAAKMTTYSAEPIKQYTVIESEVLGKIEQGTDGDTVWEITTMMGPQIKEGAERAAMLREASFDAVIRWKDLYKSVECVGIENVDEKPCYKVVMTPHEGHAKIVYYDKDSYMEVRTESKIDTMMGTMSLVVVGSDFKRVDGILIPHKIKQEVVDLQTIEMTMESIEHNAKIPPDRFKLPADIQELVNMSKAKKTPDSKKADSTS